MVNIKIIAHFLWENIGILNIIKLTFATKNKSNTQKNKLQNPTAEKTFIDSIDIIDKIIVKIIVLTLIFGPEISYIRLYFLCKDSDLIVISSFFSSPLKGDFW